ncbi:LPXTG cell wall anchor domain-containing protein [Suicoccus acidiformans]|nr:LPXTG cell wall anchor domain-containing protein [Suicoccus acidiformans]
MYGTTILKGIGLLPATGESQNYFFLGLGIVVLLVAVALIINYVRKNRR